MSMHCDYGDIQASVTSSLSTRLMGAILFEVTILEMTFLPRIVPL